MKNEKDEKQLTDKEKELEKVWTELWEFANQSINTDGIIDKDSFIDWGKKRFIVIEQK